MSDISLADFRRAVEDHTDDVWNYAYVLTRNPHTADEITQDTFVKAYRSFESYRHEASMKTWLLRITRNTWLTYRNSAFIRKVVLVEFFTGQGGNVPSAEAQYIGKLIASEIWETVLTLPAKYREVLLLHAHHQLAVPEMARTLEISEQACKSRLRRARKMAAQRMNEKGGWR